VRKGTEGVLARLSSTLKNWILKHELSFQLLTMVVMIMILVSDQYSEDSGSSGEEETEVYVPGEASGV